MERLKFQKKFGQLLLLTLCEMLSAEQEAAVVNIVVANNAVRVREIRPSTT